MKKNRMLILGIGHNTAVYVELAELLGYSVAGLYHYQGGMEGQALCGFPILGCNDELFGKEDLSEWQFGLSMGDGRIRTKLADEIRKRNGALPTMIHPGASVSKYAHLEEGVVVHANATVQATVGIECDSVVSFNSGITHDAMIERGVYIAGSSIVGAYTRVCRNAFVGMGSVVVSGKARVIGHHSVIGAGSVVTKDVDPYTIVSGNPARIVGRTDSSTDGSAGQAAPLCGGPDG